MRLTATYGLTPAAALAITIALLLPAASVAQSPPASLEPEFATSGTASGETAPAETASGVGKNASDDLWLLRGSRSLSPPVSIDGEPGAVVRIDGGSGDVIDVLDVAVEGCGWDSVAPAENALWLVRWDDGLSLGDGQGARSRGFCIGHVPLDGSAPSVFRLGVESEGRPTFGLGFDGHGPSLAPSDDGALYLIGFGVRKDSLAWSLYRFDPEAEVIGIILPGAVEMAGVGDKLFVRTLPAVFKGAKCAIAVVDQGSMKPHALKAIKKKECPTGIVASDTVVAVTTDTMKGKPTRGALIDPVSEALTGDLGAKGLGDLVVSGEAVWATQPKKKGAVPGYVVPGEKASFQTDECQHCVDPVVGLTPGAVWTTSDGILRRIDSATREVTLELGLPEMAEEVRRAE